jgi:hypothetical protein
MWAALIAPRTRSSLSVIGFLRGHGISGGIGVEVEGWRWRVGGGGLEVEGWRWRVGGGGGS